MREYEHGESLRKVHWPTTARRGQLMVKELEDSPRDEIAVVLDADGRRGRELRHPGARAGSILRTHASRGRRAVLSLNASTPLSVRVSSLDSDWQAAYEALAAVEAGGSRPVVELLSRESPAARALELVLVTARLSPALGTKLVQRALSNHGVSVVWVDAPSFAGRPTRIEPELQRLQLAGIPVAVVRAGDDLAAALSAGPARGAPCLGRRSRTRCPRS